MLLQLQKYNVYTWRTVATQQQQYRRDTAERVAAKFTAVNNFAVNKLKHPTEEPLTQQQQYRRDTAERVAAK